jgi:pimeloyl-ACP methyl ester carboxylesterase
MLKSDMETWLTDAAGTLTSSVFTSAGVSLFARVWVPGRPDSPKVLLLHGFPGTELNFDLAHSLRRAGFLVVVPHYRGSWGMGGTYSWTHVLEDAHACAAWMRSPAFTAAHGDGELHAVIGHSLGGFAALQAGVAVPTARVASIAGYNFGAAASRDRANPVVREALGRDWEPATLPLAGTSGRALAEEALGCPEDWNLDRLGCRYAGRDVLLVSAGRDEIAPRSVHHDPLVASFADAGVNVSDECLDTDHSLASARTRLCDVVCRWLIA